MKNLLIGTLLIVVSVPLYVWLRNPLVFLIGYLGVGFMVAAGVQLIERILRAGSLAGPEHKRSGMKYLIVGTLLWVAGGALAVVFRSPIPVVISWLGIGFMAVNAVEHLQKVWNTDKR